MAMHACSVGLPSLRFGNQDKIPENPGIQNPDMSTGPIKINDNVGKVLTDINNVPKGGYYIPKDCYSRHKVSILVPYRDREENLAAFLYNIHPFLMNQKLEYRIFVLEQSGVEPINKGRLFNAGFIEMQKFGTFNCVVFHDVDLLPTDSRILYTCPTFPRHMCANIVNKTDIDFTKFTFGGVTSMTVEQYKKANGHSNVYWGWGGEDNDMFWRMRRAGFPVVRYNKEIAKFKMLPHPKQDQNKYRYELLKTSWSRQKGDGLCNVEYKLLSIALHNLYTHLLINVNPYKENITELNIKWSKKKVEVV
ncbi:beta-1,4-N-acetylgalactosaminyltransferase bre-4-like [Achroia grisella]|uniref:beta-1,4-N-acetylgalactosaminyltransferase bre-4-like n=1 Tax=Achroia grisella TaxID=688607 RepID=UPI0027D294A8|nr:beta-1,4-N-acetylgalactosaminyltransferase bre-4-like [Achroia grisella]